MLFKQLFAKLLKITGLTHYFIKEFFFFIKLTEFIGCFIFILKNQAGTKTFRHTLRTSMREILTVPQ